MSNHRPAAARYRGDQPTRHDGGWFRKEDEGGAATLAKGFHAHNKAPSERRGSHPQQEEDGSRAAPLATQQPLPADQLRIVATGAKTDGG